MLFEVIEPASILKRNLPSVVEIVEFAGFLQIHQFCIESTEVSKTSSSETSTTRCALVRKVNRTVSLILLGLKVPIRLEIDKTDVSALVSHYRLEQRLGNT